MHPASCDKGWTIRIRAFAGNIRGLGLIGSLDDVSSLEALLTDPTEVFWLLNRRSRAVCHPVHKENRTQARPRSARAR